MDVFTRPDKSMICIFQVKDGTSRYLLTIDALPFVSTSYKLFFLFTSLIKNTVPCKNAKIYGALAKIIARFGAGKPSQVKVESWGSKNSFKE